MPTKRVAISFESYRRMTSNSVTVFGASSISSLTKVRAIEPAGACSTWVSRFTAVFDFMVYFPPGVCLRLLQITKPVHAHAIFEAQVIADTRRYWRLLVAPRGPFIGGAREGFLRILARQAHNGLIKRGDTIGHPLRHGFLSPYQAAFAEAVFHCADTYVPPLGNIGDKHFVIAVHFRLKVRRGGIGKRFVGVHLGLVLASREDPVNNAVFPFESGGIGINGKHADRSDSAARGDNEFIGGRGDPKSRARYQGIANRNDRLTAARPENLLGSFGNAGYVAAR